MKRNHFIRKNSIYLFCVFSITPSQRTYNQQNLSHDSFSSLDFEEVIQSNPSPYVAATDPLVDVDIDDSNPYSTVGENGALQIEFGLNTSADNDYAVVDVSVAEGSNVSEDDPTEMSNPEKSSSSQFDPAAARPEINSAEVYATLSKPKKKAKVTDVYATIDKTQKR